VAKNFKISIHRNEENLHLKLQGDFDGTSAHELLNTLKKYVSRTSKIFIHTSALKNIHPFGLDVFHSHLDLLKGRSATLVITGEYASQLAPDRHFPDLVISSIPSVTKPGPTAYK
jgi:anti-anti-sigma regulatory factor